MNKQFEPTEEEIDARMAAAAEEADRGPDPVPALDNDLAYLDDLVERVAAGGGYCSHDHRAGTEPCPLCSKPMMGGSVCCDQCGWDVTALAFPGCVAAGRRQPHTIRRDLERSLKRTRRERARRHREAVRTARDRARARQAVYEQKLWSAIADSVFERDVQ